MGTHITILEAVLVSGVSLFAWVLSKTIYDVYIKK